jgi:membrane-associated phospholipid phosphatase
LEALVNIDFALFTWINSGLSNPIFDGAMPILRNKSTWFPLYAFVSLFLWIKYKSKAVWIIAGTIICVIAADAVSSHLLKNLFERIRPCNLPADFLQVKLLLKHCSGGYSFPSSHAANHFAMAIFLGLVMYKKSKTWLIAGLVWASIISFAQIYVGVHFPFDVAAGAIVGLFIALLMYFVATQLFLKRQ